MRDVKEKAIEVFLSLNALSIIFILLAIFAFIAFTGLQFFSEVNPAEFFLGTKWDPTTYVEPSWGMLNLLMGTLLIAVGALGFAIPLGIASAIYLSKIASERARGILKPFIEMIAAIPSVVLGLFGLLVLAPLIANLFGIPNGLNALTASVLVGFMALPTIISISEDALSSVPRSYEEASYALGATKWETIKKVTVPASKSGIIASLMLGFGRVIGETMVVVMVAGNAIAMPTSFLDPVRPMTANIAIEAQEVVQGSLHYEGLFAIATILFIMTFGVNTLADWVIHRGGGPK
ncbi:phosphate ABC transporter permease [candidate division MSBL1 archaeon SCGC-AAA833F18]|uniref:Phosphate transport system permease protein n=1 Tax=candidate division MSBL1 archaeon SCGC-AAA833F18 TaxID=1698257 RepID=A0A133VRY5_9EURY|nr:phosphate ABC transporter permease [candidate division MSBL1 archaeon SCGC-AAA833F18]